MGPSGEMACAGNSAPALAPVAGFGVWSTSARFARCCDSCMQWARGCFVRRAPLLVQSCLLQAPAVWCWTFADADGNFARQALCRPPRFQRTCARCLA